MSVASYAEPIMNLGQGLVEGILGPGQTLLGSGEGYNVFTPVITFTPFLLGLLLLQVLIAFWFPRYSNVYSQTAYSQFAVQLLSFRTYLWVGLAIASAIFVWIPLVFDAFASIKRVSMVSVYYNALDILLTVLLLAFMFFLFGAFTKFNYGGDAPGNLNFYHCDALASSKNSTDASQGQCKRTKWQSVRDTFLSAMQYFFGAMLYPITNSTFLVYTLIIAAVLVVMQA